MQVTAIHAIYLINPATNDKEMRKKSLGSLTHAPEPMMSAHFVATLFREYVRMRCVRAHPIVTYL